jgi:hypothetical protein
VNPESIVFFSDVREVVEMFKIIEPAEDLETVFDIMMETMGLDCTF